MAKTYNVIVEEVYVTRFEVTVDDELLCDNEEDNRTIAIAIAEGRCEEEAWEGSECLRCDRESYVEDLGGATT